jgi:hypothetical protein
MDTQINPSAGGKDVLVHLFPIIQGNNLLLVKVVLKLEYSQENSDLKYLVIRTGNLENIFNLYIFSKHAENILRLRYLSWEFSCG